MPKVPLCEQCDEIINEVRDDYVDLSIPEEDEVRLVHATCYPEWKKVHVRG